MRAVNIKDDYIKLGQALKLANLVSNGVEAKYDIQDGKVKVNGEVCLMRGKKLYEGDSFEYKGEEVKIEKI